MGGGCDGDPPTGSGPPRRLDFDSPTLLGWEDAGMESVERMGVEGEVEDPPRIRGVGGGERSEHQYKPYLNI